ncbi:hypothetical protein ACJX0J_020302, partial [Zea mays]
PLELILANELNVSCELANNRDCFSLCCVRLKIWSTLGIKICELNYHKFGQVYKEDCIFENIPMMDHIIFTRHVPITNVGVFWQETRKKQIPRSHFGKQICIHSFPISENRLYMAQYDFITAFAQLGGIQSDNFQYHPSFKLLS